MARLFLFFVASFIVLASALPTHDWMVDPDMDFADNYPSHWETRHPLRGRVESSKVKNYWTDYHPARGKAVTVKTDSDPYNSNPEHYLKEWNPYDCHPTRGCKESETVTEYSG